MSDTDNSDEKDPVVEKIRQKWIRLAEQERARKEEEEAPTLAELDSPPLETTQPAAAAPEPIDAGRSETKRKVAPVDAIPSPVRPILILLVAVLALGFLMAFLQLVVWVLIVFEIGIGAGLGLALIPLRRWPGIGEDGFWIAAVLSVVATYVVYLLGTYLFVLGEVDVSLWEFLDYYFTYSSWLGFQPGALISVLLVLLQAGISVGAAAKTLDITRDETLDRV